MNRKHLREALTTARKEAGLTVMQLAVLLEVSPAAISAGAMSGEKWREAAKAVGLDAEDIEAAWYADACADLDLRWAAWWGAK